MANEIIVPPYGSQTSEISISAGSIDTTYSAKLVGRGAPNYGQAFAENTIRMLSHFASSAEPAGDLLEGQIWCDATPGSKTLRVYMDGAWRMIFSEGSGGGLLQPGQGGTGYGPTLADALKFLQVKVDGSGYQMVTIDDILAQSNIDNLYLRTTTTSVPTTNNTVDLGSTARRFASIYATTFNGTATSARFADLAERYESDRPLEPGTIVTLGGPKEIRSAVASRYDAVYGVISTDPAFRMNAEAGTDDTHPYVALVGRVPVKVYGPVRKHCRIVISDHDSGGVGICIANDEDNVNVDPATVVGRALESRDSQGIGLVEVALGAR